MYRLIVYQNLIKVSMNFPTRFQVVTFSRVRDKIVHETCQDHHIDENVSCGDLYPEIDDEYVVISSKIMYIHQHLSEYMISELDKRIVEYELSQ